MHLIGEPSKLILVNSQNCLSCCNINDALSKSDNYVYSNAFRWWKLIKRMTKVSFILMFRRWAEFINGSLCPHAQTTRKWSTFKRLICCFSPVNQSDPASCQSWHFRFIITNIFWFQTNWIWNQHCPWENRAVLSLRGLPSAVGTSDRQVLTKIIFYIEKLSFCGHSHEVGFNIVNLVKLLSWSCCFCFAEVCLLV